MKKVVDKCLANKYNIQGQQKNAQNKINKGDKKMDEVKTNDVKVKRITKNSRVLDYLKSHPEGITSMDAIILFGATRLSAIIFELKERGHIIVSEREEALDRYGNVSRFARYKLIETES